MELDIHFDNIILQKICQLLKLLRNAQFSYVSWFASETTSDYNDGSFNRLNCFIFFFSVALFIPRCQVPVYGDGLHARWRLGQLDE